MFALWVGGTQHPSRAPCRPLRPACLARCCPDEPEGTAQGACIGCLSHAPARTEELNVGYNSKARRAGLIVLYNTEPLSLRAETPGAGPAAQPGTPRQNRASGEPFTPGIEHGRSGRVVLTARPAAKRNFATLFSVEKTGEKSGREHFDKTSRKNQSRNRCANISLIEAGAPHSRDFSHELAPKKIFKVTSTQTATARSAVMGSSQCLRVRKIQQGST